MHPKMTPSIIDERLRRFGKKAFVFFVIPTMLMVVAHWLLEKQSCKSFCILQQGQFIELDTGSRYDNNWRCICKIEHSETSFST